MPAAGRKLSNTSNYSCVAPGPPCSSNTLMRGLLPTRLVHTLKGPRGVLHRRSAGPATQHIASTGLIEVVAGAAVGCASLRSHCGTGRCPEKRHQLLHGAPPFPLQIAKRDSIASGPFAREYNDSRASEGRRCRDWNSRFWVRERWGPSSARTWRAPDIRWQCSRAADARKNCRVRACGSRGWSTSPLPCRPSPILRSCAAPKR